GEHDHVALSDGDINYRGLTRKLAPACKHAADQQLFFARVESQDHSRSHVRRWDQRGSKLANLFRYTFFARTRLLNRSRARLRHRLNDVGIRKSPAAGRPRTCCTAAATPTASAKASGYCADVEQ